MMRCILLIAAAIYCSYACAQQTRFIQISADNPSYFSFSDGETYIPIGINMINHSGRYSNKPASAFDEIGQWMKNLSGNGGNYVRVWLSNSFWDIEEKAGVYSESKAARIDSFIE